MSVQGPTTEISGGRRSKRSARPPPTMADGNRTARFAGSNAFQVRDACQIGGDHALGAWRDIDTHRPRDGPNSDLAHASSRKAGHRASNCCAIGCSVAACDHARSGQTKRLACRRRVSHWQAGSCGVCLAEPCFEQPVGIGAHILRLGAQRCGSTRKLLLRDGLSHTRSEPCCSGARYKMPGRARFPGSILQGFVALFGQRNHSKQAIRREVVNCDQQRCGRTDCSDRRKILHRVARDMTTGRGTST